MTNPDSHSLAAGAGRRAAWSPRGCGGSRRNDARPAPASDERSPARPATAGSPSPPATPTGVYYTLGGGLAQLISDDTELQATAAETGASVQNIQQLVAGDYDIAFSLADTAADAVKGKGSFDGASRTSRRWRRIYSNYTQVVVRAGSGINIDRGLEGQEDLHRLAELRHRGDRQPAARGRRPGPGGGRHGAAARLRPDRGRHEGRPDRRTGLVRRPADPGDHRPDHLAWATSVKFIDITPLLPKMKEVNPVYEQGHDPGGDVQAARRRADDRGAERAAGPQRHA